MIPKSSFYSNDGQLQRTIAKRTLPDQKHIGTGSYGSLHPGLPEAGCFAIFIAASGTDFFAPDVMCHLLSDFTNLNFCKV